MDLEGIKRMYKRLKKAIRDKQNLAKFGNYIKCFVLFEWCNKWKKKKKNEKKLFEQMKNKKCQLEDLILEILTVVMDWEMDKGLREWMKEKKWEEKEMGVEKVKKLTGYLEKKKEWEGLKVFWIIKKIWWILKGRWIKKKKKPNNF